MLDVAVEAIVFAAEYPVSVEEIARCYHEVSGMDITTEAVSQAIRRLNGLYEDSGRSFRINNWGGGYRMATVESVSGYVKAHLSHEEERRLSRALLETLSVIAYKQPVSKPEVDHVRGVQSDYAIRQLLERDFITVVGRSDSVGRPLLYGTTEHFLDQFGLGQLEELPRPREIDELLDDPAFSHERALLTAQLQETNDATQTDNDEEIELVPTNGSPEEEVAEDE
ncbi:MAG: SMC-Scp complex subunit ScpB [Rubricoccaceae bacterium]|nr:SMC-Scp complex subunit ScpB [Rubricoccaceae bacterium]